MSSTLLANLRTQWEDASSKMTAITERAAAENRDLNDSEAANLEALRAEQKSIEPRIEQLIDIERANEATAAAFGSVSTTSRTELLRTEAPAIERLYQTPGDYLYDVMRAFGPGADLEARQRVQQVAMVRRDATTTINGATVQNETLAELYGVVPEQVVGSIWSNLDARRPLVGTFRSQPLTGPVMFRPKVSQHTNVAPQGKGTPAGSGGGAGKLGINNSGAVAANDEKSAFISQKMTIGRVNLEPVAVGGVVDLSLWAEMFTPNLLNMVVGDLQDQYVIQTEAMAAAELVRAGATNAIAAAWDPTGTTAPKDLYDAIGQAAVACYKACGRLPDTLALAVNVWGEMIGLSDTTNRPIFPLSGPMNVPGSGTGGGDASSFGDGLNKIGLRQVVSPGLPDDSIVVYASEAMEAYERRLGVLQAIEPERAGRVVSFSGLFQAIAMEDGAAVAVTHA